MAEQSTVVMGSWTGTPFADLHTSGRHEGRPNIFLRWVEVFRHTSSWNLPILLGSLLASTSDKQ